MSILIGVDPGLEGAIAVNHLKQGKFEIYDMPTIKTHVGANKAGGKTERRALDETEVLALFRLYADLGAEWCFIEQVGGIRGQSASAAFNFGRGYQTIIMSARVAGMRLEPVHSAIWKRVMRAPRDKDQSITRASELMPHQAHLWGDKAKGSKSQKSGRAEAGMLALYGERVLNGKA